MNDIVERLRAWVVNDSAELSDDDLIEAADEIVRLRGLIVEMVKSVAYNDGSARALKRESGAWKALYDEGMKAVR